MKHLPLVLFVALFGFGANTFAQQSGIRMTGVQLQVLGGIQQNGDYSLSNFQTFAGSSALLNNNFYGYNQGGMGVGGDIGFGAQGSFKLMKDGQPRANRRIRLGIAGGLSEVGSKDFLKTWHTTGDSIFNAAGAPIGYVDSLHMSSYNAHYRGNFLRFDGSMVWSTQDDRRFSFYAGAGITAGVLFHAQTDVHHGEEVTARYYYNDGTHSSLLPGGPRSNESEHFVSKGGFYSTIYLPIGFNFRLAKDHAFWSHASLYSEWRPSVVFQNYASTGLKTLFGVSHTWGVRWEF